MVSTSDWSQTKAKNCTCSKLISSAISGAWWAGTSLNFLNWKFRLTGRGSTSSSLRMMFARIPSDKSSMTFRALQFTERSGVLPHGKRQHIWSAKFSFQIEHSLFLPLLPAEARQTKERENTGIEVPLKLLLPECEIQFKFQQRRKNMNTLMHVWIFDSRQC